MRLLVAVIISAFLLPFPAFAEIKTITHTIQQPFGGSQSPDDARIAGIARAKREALEQFGTYIESTTVVKNSRVDSDEILALTAGVARAEVIKQKNYTDGDGFGIEISVKVEIDTAVLDNSLKRLLEDRNHLKDLKDAREREKKLLARIAELEKQNNKKGKTKQQLKTLKKEFQAASQGLTAVEWFDKAIVLWDGEKNSNPKKAIEYYTQAIRLDPNYSAAYNNRGATYSMLDNYNQAVADYDQAIRIDSNYAKAYNNRGITYSLLKMYEQAIADYDKAIRLDPKYATAYSNRGGTYVMLQQFGRAIADLNQAISLNSNNAKAYTNRGMAFAYIKQFDLAIADHDHAIHIDPNNSIAYSNRGGTYAMLQQFDRAIEDIDHAIHLNPNNPESYYNQGLAYANLNQLNRAITDYDKAIKLNPNYTEAYKMRGLAYLLLAKDKEGCADLEKACNAGTCAGYETTLKWCQSLKQKYKP